MSLLKIVALNKIGLQQNLELLLCKIKRRFHNVLPGDPLKTFRPNLCLTVDDSSFHCYHTLFPLLVKYDLKILLGLSTAYILEESSLPAKVRLTVPYALHMQEGIYDLKAPLCTWKELKVMVQSGHVEVAAHSHLHCNLTFPFVDLAREIIQPKRIIEKRLSCPVTSFLYPFGHTSIQLHRYVREEYPYGLSKGAGYQLSWKNTTKPLLRKML